MRERVLFFCRHQEIIDNNNDDDEEEIGVGAVKLLN